MFSSGQTCRGKSQSPVVRIAEGMETETLKPIDKVSIDKFPEEDKISSPPNHLTLRFLEGAMKSHQNSYL
jgi:hypothetical protein